MSFPGRTPMGMPGGMPGMPPRMMPTQGYAFTPMGKPYFLNLLSLLIKLTTKVFIEI